MLQVHLRRAWHSAAVWPSCSPATRRLLRLWLGVSVSLLLRPGWSIASPPLAQRPSTAQLGKVALPFIANQGQYPKAIAFAAPTFGGTVFVTQQGHLVYTLPQRTAQARPRDPRTAFFATLRPLRRPVGQEASHSPDPLVLREEVVRGRRVTVTGEGRTPTQVTVLRGKDPSQWQRDLPTYERVSLGEVYAGITLSLRVHGQTVEKVFTVQPGARPGRVQLRVRGGRRLRVTSGGELEVGTAEGAVSFSKPVAYQEEHGRRQEVEVAYVVKGEKYGFAVGRYDATKALVIDPVLVATFLGGGHGGGGTTAAALVVSPTGAVYVAGETDSPVFPGLDAGAADSNIVLGDTEAFVARLDGELRTVQAATLLGGSERERATALVVTPAGDVYVAGVTDSADFPGVDAGAADPSLAGGTSQNFDELKEVFVARLDGGLRTIKAATFLGGSELDQATALVVTPAGDVYVAGKTSSWLDFPGVDVGAADPYFDGIEDAFVARLDGGLRTIQAATFLGGDGSTVANALVVTPAGEVYVAGRTDSSDFPGIRADAADPLFEGSEGFVVRLDAGLRTILAATFLGGSDDDTASFMSDAANAVAVDRQGRVYVAGASGSLTFPGVTAKSADKTARTGDGFVVRLDAGLHTIQAGTFLGGRKWDEATALAVTPAGEVYVAGITESPNFPGISKTSADALFRGGFGDAFVVRLDAELRTIEAATFLGGSDINEDAATAVAVSPAGEVYVAGSTYSADFAGVAADATDLHFDGSVDAFVVRLDAGLSTFHTVAFLGGRGGGPFSSFSFEEGLAVAVSPTGEVYVAGETDSADFPGVDASAVDPHFVGGSLGHAAFVVRLDAELQTIQVATFLGGEGTATALAVDQQGTVYVAGWTESADFPGVDASAADSLFEGDSEAFVVRLDAGLRTLQAATFLGGSAGDVAIALVLDQQGTVYVAGWTTSADLPGVGASAADPLFEGDEAFVVRLDAGLQMIEAATFLGGSGGSDIAYEVVVAPTGEVYVAGGTDSADFPGVGASAADPHFDGLGEGFVVRLDGDLHAIEAATFLGGSGTQGPLRESVYALAVDLQGRVYAAGETDSADFPGVGASAADPHFGGLVEGFVVRLDAGLRTIQAATFLGGSGTEEGFFMEEVVNALAVDLQGTVYAAGWTNSADFPGVEASAADPRFGGLSEGFVVGLDGGLHAIQAATFLGSNENDEAFGLAVDLRGTVYVAGWTQSADFPGVDGSAADSHFGGSEEGFVARLTFVPPPYPVLTLDTSQQVAVEFSNARADLPVAVFTFSPTLSVAASGCPSEVLPGLPLLSTQTAQPGCRVLLDADPTTKGLQPFPAGTALEFGVAGPLASVQVTPLHADVFPGQIFQLAWWTREAPAPALPALVAVVRFFTPTPTPQCADCTSLDSDGDGLWDDWERFGIDSDGDGQVDLDLPALGADPTQPDLFVELDYMDCTVAGSTGESCSDGHSHRPKAAALAAAGQAFAQGGQSRDPVRLHVEVDQALPHQDFLPFSRGAVDDFAALRAQYFDPRKGFAYHYGIFSHRQKPEFFTSGRAEVGGNDFEVSLGGWNLQTASADSDGDGLSDRQVGTVAQQAGTLVHELGHNLGLQHGGRDVTNRKPNYPSVMNYAFQLSGGAGEEEGVLEPSRLFFSQGQNGPLNEKALNKMQGVHCQQDCPSLPFTFRYACPHLCPVTPGAPVEVRTGTNEQGVDWDCRGDLSGGNVSNDVNGDCSTTTLRDADDWALMQLVFQTAPDLGTSAAQLGSSDEADLVDLDVELVAARDSFVSRGAPNANEGANDWLSVHRPKHQALVSFDLAQVPAVELTQAVLVLTEAPGGGADLVSAEGIEVLELRTPFTEGAGRYWQEPQPSRGSGAGVTWACATDREIGNGLSECSAPWPNKKPVGDGGPALLVQRQEGVWQWDVTAAVAAARAAGQGEVGWLMREAAGEKGAVVFYSREGAERSGAGRGAAPRLIIRFN